MIHKKPRTLFIKEKPLFLEWSHDGDDELQIMIFKLILINF